MVPRMVANGRERGGRTWISFFLHEISLTFRPKINLFFPKSLPSSTLTSPNFWPASFVLLLANKLSSHRLVQTVLEEKAALEPWSFYFRNIVYFLFLEIFFHFVLQSKKICNRMQRCTREIHALADPLIIADCYFCWNSSFSDTFSNAFGYGIEKIFSRTAATSFPTYALVGVGVMSKSDKKRQAFAPSRR